MRLSASKHVPSGCLHRHIGTKITIQVAPAHGHELTCQYLLDGFWSPNNYYGFLNTFKYDREKVALDKYTLIEAAHIRTVYNWLQYFSPEELAREIVECGFAVDGIYSDVAGSPFDSEAKEFAVVGKKT